MELLSFENTKKLLLEYQIPFLDAEIVHSEKDIIMLAKKMKYPLALKVFGPKILHRTDIGGVVSNINNQKELTKAFSLLRKIKGIEGVLIQKMGQGEQIVLGMKRDEQFGPVLMFGLGGIFVEILKDVSFRVCPISSKEALKMIKEIKAYSVLKGARTGKEVNINALVDMIVKLSRLSLKEKSIKEIDLNPVIANEKGAWAADFKFFV